MSVELELQSFSLRPADVHRMISTWLETSSVRAESVRLEHDVAQLFIAGTSIRGFSLHSRRTWFRNRIDLRLSVCASEGDWQAAYSFLRFALRRDFEVRSEDGSTLRVDALTEEAALRMGREQFVKDVHFVRQLMTSSADEAIELPNARFAVPVKRDDLEPEPFGEKAPDSLHGVLQRRAAKYATARSASLITLKTSATAIVWSGEALLAPTADYVVMGRGEFDPARCVYVSWDHAIKELADAVEKIQRNPAQYYFAEVSATESRWQRLVGAGAPIDQLGETAG